MANRNGVSERGAIALCALALSAGLIGSSIGKAFGVALQTSPAWMGPAVLVGLFAIVIVAALLVPAAVRGLRSKRAGTAP